MLTFPPEEKKRNYLAEAESHYDFSHINGYCNKVIKHSVTGESKDHTTLTFPCHL